MYINYIFNNVLKCKAHFGDYVIDYIWRVTWVLRKQDNLKVIRTWYRVLTNLVYEDYMSDDRSKLYKLITSL